MTASTFERLQSNARALADLATRLRQTQLRATLAASGVQYPTASFPRQIETDRGPRFTLDLPLKAALSKFVRRTRISLPAFVELVRGQSHDDYRPNKSLNPRVFANMCQGYKHQAAALQIMHEGVRVALSRQPPERQPPPRNHGSARERLNVVIKNVRKEQDAGRCLVLDRDLLALWPEVRLSPFGVVDKAGADPAQSGRLIHDLSYPEGLSINDCTDQASIIRPDYLACHAVASQLVAVKASNPPERVELQAGDVASAFRHVSIHSNSVHLFGGTIPEADALVLDLSAPFGWTGSLGAYELFGGAIAFIHGTTMNEWNRDGFFSYHWVDDHVNIAVPIGTNREETERSLRAAMIFVLGADAINEDKFSEWEDKIKILGLYFDTVAGTVAMPQPKVAKAKILVATAYNSTTIPRREYRSLMGSLRHVATCIRAARPFLQRMRIQESQLTRFAHVRVLPGMKADLLWWWRILHSPRLNGVPLEYFGALPQPDIVVSMDACDTGLCAVDTVARRYITYEFSATERALVAEFKRTGRNEFDINYRELLSAAFAVRAWGATWQRPARLPTHVRFRIDNTSAVAWQQKMASRNTRAQVIIRLLGYWEEQFGLRFSSTHVPGVDNILADAGSRRFDSPAHDRAFTNLTRDWRQDPTDGDLTSFDAIWAAISERDQSLPPPSTSTA